MPRGAPHGPRLARAASAAKRTHESLGGVAYQVGLLVMLQRNRWKLNQAELGALVGMDQTDISRIENGTAPSRNVTDAQLKAMFKEIGLQDAQVQLSFLQWWRVNG